VPCRLWRAQVLPAWQRTEQFKKLVFRQIEARTWKDLEIVQTWPEDLRWMREAFVADWRTWTARDQVAGQRPTAEGALSLSPRFYVGRDGRLLEAALGKAGWQHSIQPLLNRLLGEA
jgi:hypothetical protein